ncbi:GNAT family N-acetyltransferase [Anaerohalosphaeraceae bacterium U12dextr]
MQVVSVKYSDNTKTFRLRNGVKTVTHRFCCLGEGDDLILKGKNVAYAKCINGKAIILPAYSSRDQIIFGAKSISLIVKEPITEKELSGYHKLEEYHYRGTCLHGRRVPLIVTSSDPLLPDVLGYIELATAFLMNRPRTELFNHPFCDSTKRISWSIWDKNSAKQYTNIVVRIARCVVSPEFRGLGLSRLLVKHAIAFARNRWHVAKLKPLFLEITADMLRYIPFVESAKMHYIGETEGNLNRLEKDMNYILANFDRVKKGEILKEQSGGIVDLQVHYAVCLKQIESEHRVSREDLLKLLIQSPQKLSDDNWTLLHRIFRLPKPTFIVGLTPAAKKYVLRRKHQLHLPDKYPVVRPQSFLCNLSRQINVQNCSLHLDSPLVRTKYTRIVQQAFGISRDMLRTTLFSNLSFHINPGDVVLLCGPSGAGKTTLLSLLRERLSNSKRFSGEYSGNISVPVNATIQNLEPLSNRYPLVNSLGKIPFEDALYALNISGLAEAHLYIKRFKELSNGQRYRAMIAKLIASKADIWMADEFCATLDPITANIVARNLRRCAKEFGVTIILAAANWCDFIEELRPDTIVHLRSPWDFRIFTWNKFRRAIIRSQIIRQ